MKCRCGNPVSDIHNVEKVMYKDEQYEMSWATITKIGNHLLCAECERAVGDLGARAITERNEQELAGEV